MNNEVEIVDNIYEDEDIKEYDAIVNYKDWIHIHQQIKELRIENKLTILISDFLTSCGLDPNRAYYKQLACVSGNRLCPSNRYRTPDFVFKSVIKKYVSGQREIILSHSDLDMILVDWSLDNCHRLENLGIVGIHIKESGPVMIIRVRDHCTMDNDTILDMLFTDSSLSSSLRDNGVSREITVHRIVNHLLSLLSPKCFIAKGSTGTGTTINYHGSALTMEKI